MSGSGSGVSALKKELKVLSSRLEATSMREYYRSIQGFKDALSLVDEGSLKDDKEKGLYAAARRLSTWLDVYYIVWDLSSDSAIKLSSSRDRYAMYCTDARRVISYVNSAMGEQVLTYDGTPIKGMFVGNLGAVIYGNFADLLIGMFGQLEILVAPYTDFAKGTVGVSAMQSIDIAVRHAESFAAIQDAIA